MFVPKDLFDIASVFNLVDAKRDEVWPTDVERVRHTHVIVVRVRRCLTTADQWNAEGTVVGITVAEVVAEASVRPRTRRDETRRDVTWRVRTSDD
jgi:hypothetical protein